jgi:hypothetical protein
MDRSEQSSLVSGEDRPWLTLPPHLELIPEPDSSKTRVVNGCQLELEIWVRRQPHGRPNFFRLCTTVGKQGDLMAALCQCMAGPKDLN